MFLKEFLLFERYFTCCVLLLIQLKYLRILKKVSTCVSTFSKDKSYLLFYVNVILRIIISIYITYDKHNNHCLYQKHVVVVCLDVIEIFKIENQRMTEINP